MAYNKEVEIKWNAEKVSRTSFNSEVVNHLRKNALDYELITVSGFDYYYSSKQGYVARHRSGVGSNELTTKSRLSKTTITIRKEINIKLPVEVSPLEIKELMFELGFRKVLPIFKICDIYVIQDGKCTVDIVWYIASCRKKPSVTLVEVEVHGASPTKSLKILNKWKKLLLKLHLTDKQIIPDSLYEIFSGKRYLMAKGK